MNDRSPAAFKLQLEWLVLPACDNRNAVQLRALAKTVEQQNVLPASSRTTGKSGRSAAMKGTKNVHHGSLGRWGLLQPFPTSTAPSVEHCPHSRGVTTQQQGRTSPDTSHSSTDQLSIQQRAWTACGLARGADIMVQCMLAQASDSAAKPLVQCATTDIAIQMRQPTWPSLHGVLYGRQCPPLCPGVPPCALPLQ